MTSPTPSQAAEKAMREALELPPHPDPHNCTWSALEKRCIREWAESQLAEMRAEVERLSKNDARYRWLRHGDNDEKVLRQYGDATNTVYIPRLDHLDRLIDAALAADEKDGA